MDEDLDERLNRPYRLRLGIALILLMVVAIGLLFGAAPDPEVDLHRLNPHTYNVDSP